MPPSEVVKETEMKTAILAVIVLCALATDSFASQREHDPDRTLNGRALGTLEGRPQHVIYLPSGRSGRRPTAFERMEMNRYRQEHGEKNQR
jgi:hypothetical protein